MLVAVDPGTREAGVAVFEDGVLTAAWLERGSDWRDTASRIYQSARERGALYETTWVVELPQVYTQNKLKGDPNDLIRLALMVGALGSLVSNITLCTPRQWKGQTPKKVMEERIKAKLSIEELKRIELPARSYRHNVWDAIGIGQHFMKRR